MITTSMSRMVVPFLALVAASGMALVFAIQHVGREPPADTRAATGVPARDQAPAALGAAQAEANALTAELAGPPPAAASGDGAPSFDIARVEPTGDAGSSGSAMADAWALAESLLPGTALALLLVEHGWAQALFGAVSDSGGALLGEGFLTAEAGLVVGAEVAALEEAAEVIAVAQAAEARATLAALAAETEAADAIAASEAIVAGAAAVAVRALIDAGIVQEAAAHEAVEALNAAGLMVAAADRAAAGAAAAVRTADQTAAEAVAQDAIEVMRADQAAAEAVTEAAADVAAASMTVAEERVLRYLPTRLTFALIADKLGISRSAAKERAECAYKKLGVHNRADAVNRARALGLID